MARALCWYELHNSQSTNPSPAQVLQGLLEQVGYDVAVSNLTRLPIEQQFGELELQAMYGPVVVTGVENERLVGVATLGDRLFFTLVCSEEAMLRSEPNPLLKEAINLLNEAITLAKIMSTSI
jgi:hypothetical protein